MKTARAIYADVTNIIDYFANSDLLLDSNSVTQDRAISINEDGQPEEVEKIRWHRTRGGEFIPLRGNPTLRLYEYWVINREYSALLIDGSLLQISYDVTDNAVSGHRLGYVPTPYSFDPDLIQREPIERLIALHNDLEPENIILHSSVRFDFDPTNARKGHPASHLTINKSSCRIACSAPLHAGRFVDFVFRHFYPKIWAVHKGFFESRNKQDLGEKVLDSDDSLGPHVTWNSR